MQKGNGDASRADPGQGVDVRAALARRRELHDWLNRCLYHPLSRRIAAFLARGPVTPNQVSVMGGACVAMAGLAYGQLPWPGSVMAGLLLHMAWHVLDGADGDLARMSGRSSAFGEMVDGISDYAGHLVLYVLLGGMLAGQIGHAAWLAMLAAGLSRVVQTNHFEVQRRLYQWRVYGTSWIGSTGLDDARGLFGGLLDIYLRLSARLTPEAPATDAALRAAIDDPRRLETLHRIAREETIGPLARLAPLGSNQRTIILGVSMAAGSPLWYFLYEATLLNLSLVWSIRRHRRAALNLESRVAGLAQ